jgi:predicted amidohydrolase
MKKLRVALVQMCSGDNPFENLALVNDFVQEACEQGADLVCFPENVFYRGPKKREGFDRTELFLSLSDNHRLELNSDFSKALYELMQNWPIAVSLGSVLELSEDPQMPYNSHFFVYPKGEKILSYRKIHLFEFHGNEAFYNESRDIRPGSQTLGVEWKGVNIGLSICFDLRFPELFRELALRRASQVFLIPAAFASETGRAHWHTLLRARAIENQVYVLASAQWGPHLDSKMQSCSCYGHALAYSPWGDSLAEAPERGDFLLCVDLDLQAQKGLRERLPALKSAKLL